VGFESLRIKQVYDTSTDNLVEDFFEPILRNAKTYDRGVGFFSSGWLKANAFGLTEFAENGGHARWVTSPILSEYDWDKIRLGSEARLDELLFKALSETIEDLQKALEKKVLDALAWLIADNVIDFKLAVPRNQLTGEFHDKFGIFTDADGKQISFSGSYNDSIQGLRNYESIVTFCSWNENSSAIVASEQNRFTKLWQNEDPNVRVFDIPESIKQRIVKLRSSERPYNFAFNEFDYQEKLKPHPTLPTDFKPREYQNEAVKAWFDNSNKGFFDMATGTGKTKTSLLAAVQLFERQGRIALIITCPYKHLVEQWDNEVVSFGFLPIRAYESFASWSDDLGNRIMAFNNKDTDSLCVITTNTTFLTDRFANLIKQINGPMMLIADEAHHFGTEKSKQYFPHQIPNRLALSATPNRWFDEEGTNTLKEYFGETIYSFPLARAIEEGYLTPYEYHPIPVELTDAEMDSYADLTAKIVPILSKQHKTENDEKRLLSLLLRRADILKNAEKKLDELRKILKQLGKIDHAIFYCAPAQRVSVLQILGLENRIRTHQFTYREDSRIRRNLLNQFDRGILQAIVAIKCLDEGVDVPSSRTAFFLANSSNPREFVQRRGRVLRKADGKTKAALYDFLTIPPDPEDKLDYELTRKILKKELTRFDEFAKSSLTFHGAYEVIWEIARKFNVLDF